MESINFTFSTEVIQPIVNCKEYVVDMSKMRLLPVCFIKDEDEESEGEKLVFRIDGKENNDTIIKRG